MTADASRRSFRLFVTGTDTGVGKTYVSCLICRQSIHRGLITAAYKPVCSGADVSDAGVPRWDDIERLKAATGHQWRDDQICSQRFLAPLAPPIAARLEGKSVDFDQLVKGSRGFDQVDLLVIEGAGGWLSPISETVTNAELAKAFAAPVLIVARTGLGTINHTLLTIQSIRSYGVSIAGVVLNRTEAGADDLSSRTNAAEIEARSGVPVFGVVDFGSESKIRHSDREVSINWKGLAGAFDQDRDE